MIATQVGSPSQDLSVTINGNVYLYDSNGTRDLPNEPNKWIENSDVSGELLITCDVVFSHYVLCGMEIDPLGAPDTPVDRSVLGIAGQSNAVGRASIETGIDEVYTGVGDSKQFGWETQQITNPVNPLDHADENPGDMGFHLSMLNDLITSAIYQAPILLVPTAKGGSSFSGNHWNKGEFYYEACVARINAAMGTAGGNRLEAFIWYQGESDLGHASYLSELTQMRQDMIADIPSMTNETPWIVVKIKIDPMTAQADAVNSDLSTFVASLPNGSVIETSDLTNQDALHIDAPSLRSVGHRVATALQGLLPVPSRILNLDTDNQITAGQTFNINLAEDRSLAINEEWQAWIAYAGTNYPLTVNSQLDARTVNVTAPGDLPVFAHENATAILARIQFAL